MDNRKIGKIIAELRKKQGLTQQELGDKVGVGFRAVSKWERGLTLPDISIINDVSKILGISSDELLAGKINKENKSKEKKKLSNKIKVTITIITSIIVVLLCIFTYYNNKTYVYDVYSGNLEEYYVEGQTTFHKNEITLIINKIIFKDVSFLEQTIKNYEYDIKVGEKFIFRYGYLYGLSEIDNIITIYELFNNFNINHNSETKISKKDILENNINITFKFLDENDKEIIKKIEVKLK